MGIFTTDQGGLPGINGQPGVDLGSLPNPLLNGLFGVGAGLAGLFPTPTNTNSNTTGSQTTVSGTTGSTLISQLMNLVQSQKGTQTSTPNLTKGNQDLIDQLTKQYSSMVNSNINSDNLIASNTQAVNRNSDAQSKALEANLASRGLSTSPVAATAQAGVTNQRFQNINQFQTNLPLLMQQLKLNSLGQAGSFAASIPHGTTTTNQQDNTSNQTTTGSNDTYNNGTQQVNSNNQTTQQQKSGGGAGGFLSGLMSVLPLLLAI